MIQNENLRDSSTFGFEQKNALTIPEESMNYIIDLLSSNLYTEPVTSFLRESISNALDANTEKNKSNPVRVILNNAKNYIEIQDSGMGISPQRFQDTYLKLGSSTKRNDNTQIGGFGLGRLSSLACSNNIFIDTIYYDDNTQEYIRDVYNMYKSNVGVNIENIIHERIENGITGTFVRAYLNDKMYRLHLEYDIRKMFPILVNDGSVRIITNNPYYGESEYPLGQISYEEYDNFYIVNTFTLNSGSPIKNSVLIGNVLYNVYHECYRCELSSSDKPDKNNILSVIPKLNIGEVDFVPSRDSLKYSQRTKDALTKAFKNTIIEMISKDCSHPFKNIDFLYNKDSVLYSLFLKDGICLDLKNRNFSMSIHNPNYMNTCLLSSGPKIKCLTACIEDDKPQSKIDTLGDILQYAFRYNAKIVLTNRVMNDTFFKEKQSLTDPTVYIPVYFYKSRLGEGQKIQAHGVLTELMKYIPDNISFESKSKFKHITKETTTRRDSSYFSIKFVTDSLNYSYDTYNTKLESVKVRIEDIEDYPLILTPDTDLVADRLLRFLYSIRKNIDKRYSEKLFPRELRFGICSPTVFHNLVLQKKAISLSDYINSDNIIINLIRLRNTHGNWADRLPFYLNKDVKDFLLSKGVEEEVIKSTDMLVQLLNNSYLDTHLSSKDIMDLIGRDINYSRFSKSLPLLKDLIYNHDILRVHNLSKYFIPRYTNIKKMHYGK